RRPQPRQQPRPGRPRPARRRALPRGSTNRKASPPPRPGANHRPPRRTPARVGAHAVRGLIAVDSCPATTIDTHRTFCWRGPSPSHLHPNRRMIARLRLPTCPAIHTGGLQPLRERFVQEQEVDPQARVVFPVLTEKIPEREDLFVWVELANRVGPAL